MSAPAQVDLVVAHYLEDTAWLRRVPRAVRVWLYHKGGTQPPAHPAAQVAVLPNVGREAHTYLHHLVTRYEDLAALTVLVQGRPFDHVPDLHRVLRRWASGEDRVDEFRWLGFLVDEDDRTGSRLFQRWSKNPEHRPLAMPAFWDAVFGAAPCPESFVFFGGANFAVRRETVRRRPRAFYERALRVAAAFPDAAHGFERTWDHVFGVNGIPPACRGKPLPLYLKPIRRLLDGVAS